MLKETHNKRVDIVILSALLFVGVLYGVLTKGLFIGTALITFSVFTIPPAIYLTLRRRKDCKKVLLSAAIFGILFAIPFDFFEEYTGSWHAVSLVIPFKILNIEPVDSIIAHIEMTILTVVFYQHFIDNEQSAKISKRIFLAISLSIGALFTLGVLYIYSPMSLNVTYPYGYMGIVALIPPIFLAWRKPNLIQNMVATSVYFFVLYFCIEMIAVRNMFWIYPGRYIGWVSIFDVSFPFEELFFWMMLYAICIVSYYEVFIKG